jgi:predicted DNA-binding ribbon-helix-helix protein
MGGGPSGIAKRSVTVAGHRTSLSLEAAFWDALHRIAGRRGMSVSRLVAEIDRAADPGEGRRNLSSAVRVFVLEAVRAGEDRD